MPSPLLRALPILVLGVFAPLRADRVLAAEEPGRLAALATAVRAGEFKKVTSLLVQRDGKTLCEEYFHEGGPEVLNDTRSAMKSVTALAVGAALRDGHLKSVDAPIFDLLADLAPFQHDGPLKRGITVADFLTMSSAFDANDWDDDSPGNEELMYPQQSWSRWAVDLPVRANYRRDASGRGPFSYCTGGVFLLGQILQRTTGEPVDRYIERTVLAPLGIARTEWPRSPSGEVMTGGGLRLRTRDLARLTTMVLDEGRWEGKQVLPAEWIRQCLTVQRPSISSGQDYGFLFWRRDYAAGGRQHSGWFMSGNGGNHLILFRDLRAVVVITTKNYNTRGMHQQTQRMVEEFVLPALAAK